MNTTINISLPKKMLKDAKRVMLERSYSSVSELMRDSLREKIYKKQEYTVNGFTPEFEEEVLKAERESIENDIVLKTEEDINKHFDEISRELGFSK